MWSDGLMLVSIDDLPGNLIGRFEGRDHGSSVSFFIGTFDAGTAIGDESLALGAGQIIVVPAGTPHKFVSGFRMIRELACNRP